MRAESSKNRRTRAWTDPLWRTSEALDLGWPGEYGRDPTADTEDMGAQFVRAGTGEVRVERLHGSQNDEVASELLEGELLELTRRQGPGALARWLVHAFETGRLQAPEARSRQARVDEGRVQHRLDLTEESVHEASLLDFEAEEWGEVQSPRLHTEDTRSHARVRSRHAGSSFPPRDD